MIRVVPVNGTGFKVVFEWGDGMMKNIPLAEAKTVQEANNVARACRAAVLAEKQRISGSVNDGLSVNYLPAPAHNT
ncbi:MAG: hypothetical protein Q7S11_01510 [bacterium]|nr:hypothetical protein [bacterium]